MKCPMRKDIIRQKREKEKENKTYANVISHQSTPWNMAASPPVNKETHLKIYACMLHAHILNITEPGCYEKELNSTLTANNLPTIKIPKTPDSNKFIKILTQEERDPGKEGGEDEKQDLVNAKEDYSVGNKKAQQNEYIREPTEKETTITTQAIHKPKLNSKDIQLKIYTPESSGWPDNMTSTELTTKMNNSVLKYTFSDHTIDDSELFTLIESNKIKMDNSCWHMVDDSIFKKIRSGYLAEKTPPPKDILRRQRKCSK